MRARTQIVNIQGVEIAVPVGPWGEPTELAKLITQRQQDASNWKLPVKPFLTYDRELAVEVALAFDFYFGGHECEELQYDRFGTLYQVGSKGYYHYIGA